MPRGFVDALDALLLVLARFDVLVLAGADINLGGVGLFYPSAVLLEGFRGKIHGLQQYHIRALKSTLP